MGAQVEQLWGIYQVFNHFTLQNATAFVVLCNFIFCLFSWELKLVSDMKMKCRK